jgi:hypothetical protein
MPWMRCATGLDRFAPPGPLGRNEIPSRRARRVCGRRTRSGSRDRHLPMTGRAIGSLVRFYTIIRIAHLGRLIQAGRFSGSVRVLS